jgi:hypothetical protein
LAEGNNSSIWRQAIVHLFTEQYCSHFFYGIIGSQKASFDFNISGRNLPWLLPHQNFDAGGNKIILQQFLFLIPVNIECSARSSLPGSYHLQ